MGEETGGKVGLGVYGLFGEWLGFVRDRGLLGLKALVAKVVFYRGGA
jgi:hypothetical protein